MPATFPAHPAAVLPLKLWRPAWFDGLALAVGSMAPDLAYALDGSPLEQPFPGLAPLWQLAHSLPWFLAWALPTTFALCLLIRLSAPAIATHLPTAVPTHRPATPSTAALAIDPPATSPTAAPVATDLPAVATHRPAIPSPTAAATDLPAVSPTAAPVSTDLPTVATHLPSAPPITAAATASPVRLVAAPRGPASRHPVLLHRLAFSLVALLRGAVSLDRGPRWYVTVSSAGIGALSHVLWDRIAVGPLDLASSLLGGLICLWLLHRLTHRRASTRPPVSPAGQTIPGSRPPQTPKVGPALAGAPLASQLAQSVASPAGHNAPGVGVADLPRVGSVPGGDSGRRRRPTLYWGTFAAVLVSGGASLPSLPGYFLPHTMSARIILLAVGAAAIAAAAASATTGLRVSGSRGKPLQQ